MQSTHYAQYDVPPKQPTALVLDDDAMIRSEIGEMLSEFNYRVRYCNDFISALQEMEFDDDVALVIADYHLLGDEKRTFNGMLFIDCCRMRYPHRNIQYFLMSGDREPLIQNKDDKEVPMISKTDAIEQLSKHVTSCYGHAAA